jgi:LacI family transcriptional regulator
MKDKRLNVVPTIYDIAQKAGVAPGTVSRTLNNIGYIKEETRQKVEQAAKELNYIPNRAARTLKTKKTGLILLAIPDTDNPFYIDMIKAAMQTAKANEYSLVLYYTEGNEKDEIKALKMLHEHFADGMILVTFELTERHLKEMERINCPLVLTSINVGSIGGNEKDRFDYVGVDSQKGVYLAVKHLINQGHTRIGYLGGSDKLQVFKDRYKGYEEALIDSGLDREKNLVFWKNYTESSGYQGAKYLLTLPERPTAICAANDLMALGALRAVEESGLRVPDDISIIGMDNMEVTSRLKPKLSTVALAQAEIGRTSAELIFSRLNGSESGLSKKVIFEPRLIVRESSVLYSEK